MIWWFFFVFVFSETPTPIVDDSKFTCAGITITPLAGNDAAIDIVRLACQNHPVCNEQFATEYLGDIDAFKTLLQQVNPFTPPINLESPIQELVCESTLEEVRNLLWAEKLVQALNEVFPCAPGERFTLIKNGTEGKCVPLVSNTLNTCASEHSLRWFFYAAVVLLLMWTIINSIFTLKTNKAKIQ